MYWYGLIVPILSFFLQVWPRLINRYFGVDPWRHLTTAEYIRENNRLPKSMINKYILPVPFGYPPMLAILLSFFPKKFAEKYQFMFSPVIDSITNFLIFLSALFLTNDIKAAIFAQLISLSTPITVLESSILNPRTLSYLIFYSSFFPLLMYSLNGNLFFLLLAACMLFILFFTHKLAIQAYLFNIVSFSILERNPFYILFFFVVFGLAFILSGGLYKTIFKDHLLTLNIFRKYYDFRLHQFRKEQNEKGRKDFIYKLYKLSFKNPFIYIMGNNPWLALLIILYIFSFEKMVKVTSQINSAIFIKLNIWIFILLGCGLLILSIKKIKFLGEGNRYIEYVAFPISVILGCLFSSFLTIYGLKFLTVFIMIFLTLIGSIVYIQTKIIVQDKLRTITSDLWKVINYLQLHEDENIRIFFSPTSLGDPVMYFVSGKALLTDSARGIVRLKDILPVVSKPMDEIVTKYNLNYILIKKSYVTLEELKLKHYKNVKKFGDYMLINL